MNKDKYYNNGPFCKLFGDCPPARILDQEFLIGTMWFDVETMAEGTGMPKNITKSWLTKMVNMKFLKKLVVEKQGKYSFLPIVVGENRSKGND